MKSELLRAWCSKTIAMCEKLEHDLLMEILSPCVQEDEVRMINAMSNLITTITAIEALRKRINMLKN